MKTAKTTLRYGAFELKQAYNRNLATAFGMSVLLCVLLALTAHLAGGLPDAQPHAIDTTTYAPTVIKKLKTAKDESGAGRNKKGDSKQPHAVPPGPTTTRPGGGIRVVHDRTDTVPTPPAAVSPSIADVLPSGPAERDPGLHNGQWDGSANGNGLGSDDGGGGGDGRGKGKDDGTQPAPYKPQSTPDEDTPIDKAVTSDPSCDYDELTRRVRYPDLARRNGIEGKVVVRVLVDRDGVVIKSVVESSDNLLLDGAAVEAVMATKFKPAMLEDSAVRCWVWVPVNFRLGLQ